MKNDILTGVYSNYINKPQLKSIERGENMDTFGVVLLAIWLIVGVLVFASNRVTKLAYGCTWLCLIIQIIMNYAH